MASRAATLFPDESNADVRRRAYGIHLNSARFVNGKVKTMSTKAALRQARREFGYKGNSNG